MKTWRTKLYGSEVKIMCFHEGATVPIDLWQGRVLDTPEMAVAYLEAQLIGSVIYRADVENLMVIYLNTRKRPISWQVISTGSIDTLLVHAREVFKGAIVLNASAIILAHNHPSGDPCPSEADIKVTRDLIRAGQLLKIDVVDHVILGRATPDQPKTYASLRELGYFYT